MKKTMIMALSATVLLLLTGCGTGFPNGLLYTQLNIPLTVNISDKEEIGTYMKSEAVGYKLFGLFAWGDTSYEAALKNGKFSRIQRVEYFSYDICGCGYYGIRIIGEPVKIKGDNK